MLSYFKLATATLLTFGALSFAQDVSLTIDGTSLNYESSADIYGFQFSHDGCAIGVLLGCNDGSEDGCALVVLLGCDDDSDDGLGDDQHWGIQRSRATGRR